MGGIIQEVFMSSLRSVLIFLVLAIIISGNIIGQSLRERSSFWVERYGEVTERENSLVLNAKKIYEKLLDLVEKKANGFIVIRTEGEPWALSLPDGYIIMTYGALKICYAGVGEEEGNARVAFIISHELAHIAKNDFWHAYAFTVLKRQEIAESTKQQLKKYLKFDLDDKETRELIKRQELQADGYALTYMTMAAYDPYYIIGQDKDFFTYWVSQVTKKYIYDDPTHPSPKERAEFVKSQLKDIIDKLPFYNFAVKFYQMGDYENAIMLFREFNNYYQAKEVYNNIGLSYYQLALQNLLKCDENLALKHKLSVYIEEKLPIEEVVFRGGVQECYIESKFKENINEAIKNLNIAVSKDKAYIKGKLNLSAALIIAKEYSKAISYAEEVLNVDKDNLDAINNKAIALYYFGKENKIDTTEKSIELLKEGIKKDSNYSNALYNLGMIQKEIGKEAEAKESWNRFLKIEGKGQYSDYICKIIGKEKTKGKQEASKGYDSPIRFGRVNIEELTKDGYKEILDRNLGTRNVTIYQKGNTKILTIDDYIKIIEKEPEGKIGPENIKGMYGEPERVYYSKYGDSFVYEGFIINFVDGKANKVYLYEKGKV